MLLTAHEAANANAILMQDGAQIAALISQGTYSGDKEGVMRAWTIGLGGYEATITLSTYKADYLRFLKGEAPGTNTFLERTEYGRFSLDPKVDMQDFLRFVAMIMRDDTHTLLK